MRPVSRPRLVLIEDDAALRRSLQLLLQGKGFDVRAYPSGAHLMAETGVPDAYYLVADYRLPDSDGVHVLRALRERGWQGHAILVTGFPSAQLTVDAAAAGYARVLEKPLRQHELVSAIRTLGGPVPKPPVRP